MNTNSYHRLPVYVLLASCAFTVQGATDGDEAPSLCLITDGTLAVDVENNGKFNQVSLGGEPIDSTPELQQFYVNGEELTPVPPPGGMNYCPTETAATVTYKAEVEPFSIQVESSILAVSDLNLLEQVVTLTNTARRPQALSLVSYMDQDLAGDADDDTVAYDETFGDAIYAVDETKDGDPTMFMAATAQTDSIWFEWDLGLFADVPTELPLGNNLGPVDGDTAMAIGYDFGTIAPGQAVTVTFHTLFSLDESEVPEGFALEQPVQCDLNGDGRFSPTDLLRFYNSCVFSGGEGCLMQTLDFLNSCLDLPGGQP